MVLKKRKKEEDDDIELLKNKLIEYSNQKEEDQHNNEIKLHKKRKVENQNIEFFCSNENLLKKKFDYIVRFFIIGIKNFCNKEIPNINNIFPNKNNLEMIKINPLYEIIMDQRIQISSMNKLNSYFVFIKWKLDNNKNKDEKTLEQTTY